MSNEQFPLEKNNMMVIGAGFALVVIGFLLMAGGGDEDPTQFTRRIFNFQRLYLAPCIVLVGYGVVMWGIIKKPKKQE